MKIEVNKVTDWIRVLNAARFTAGKSQKAYTKSVSDDFKRKICNSEHSPLRLLEFDIKCYDVPFFVVSHITRHKYGVEFFVSTSRPDRNSGKPDRHEQRKDDLTDIQMSINAQALINISRKRLCYKAEAATRMFWECVCNEVASVDPVLGQYLVKDCQYKRHCTEIESCGWLKQKTDK